MLGTELATNSALPLGVTKNPLPDPNSRVPELKYLKILVQVPGPIFFSSYWFGYGSAILKKPETFFNFFRNVFYIVHSLKTLQFKYS